jgi:hypothetical protein
MKCGIAASIRSGMARAPKKPDIASVSVVMPGGLHSAGAELVDHIGVPVQHEGVVGDGHDLDHEVVFGALAVGVEEMSEDRIGCERVGERLDRRLAIAGSRVPREAHVKPRSGSSGGRRSQLSAG